MGLVALRHVNLPGAGIEPVSPVWVGRFLSTAGENLLQGRSLVAQPVILEAICSPFPWPWPTFHWSGELSEAGASGTVDRTWVCNWSDLDYSFQVCEMEIIVLWWRVGEKTTLFLPTFASGTSHVVSPMSCVFKGYLDSNWVSPWRLSCEWDRPPYSCPLETSLFLKKKWFNLFLAVLGLHCCMSAFSSCSKPGVLSSCSAQASPCSGFSCCRAYTLERVAFSSCGALA